MCVPKLWQQLVVTLDDVKKELFSAFPYAGDGISNSFDEVAEMLSTKGEFRSLYADRTSHYWTALEAGGKVDRKTARALVRDLGVDPIPLHSLEAGGRSGRRSAWQGSKLPHRCSADGRSEGIPMQKLACWRDWL